MLTQSYRQIWRTSISSTQTQRHGQHHTTKDLVAMLLLGRIPSQPRKINRFTFSSLWNFLNFFSVVAGLNAVSPLVVVTALLTINHSEIFIVAEAEDIAPEELLVVLKVNFYH